MTTHGSSDTAEHVAWCHMKSRCYDKNNVQWDDWGGRGIVVCDRWRDSFDLFLLDMGVKPSPEHTLDRIENDGNYEPGNCRWATRIEQNRNRRSVRMLEWDGNVRCITEWSIILGIKFRTLMHRLALGWSVERVLTEPVAHRGKR